MCVKQLPIKSGIYQIGGFRFFPHFGTILDPEFTDGFYSDATIFKSIKKESRFLDSLSIFL